MLNFVIQIAAQSIVNQKEKRCMKRTYNITVFRKVLNSPLDESKGFEIQFYTRWRGVSNFRKMFSYLDREAPDWWYVNVYDRKSKGYLGRIYTDSRNTDFN